MGFIPCFLQSATRQHVPELVVSLLLEKLTGDVKTVRKISPSSSCYSRL